jgi:hypothetical protein
MYLAPIGLCAQSLVFHECGGGETVVTLPADMHIEASSGVVTFSSGSSSVAIPLDSVLAVTFRNKTGDVDGDTQVDVVDIATIISIMAGQGSDDSPGTGSISINLRSEVLANAIDSWPSEARLRRWYCNAGE